VVVKWWVVWRLRRGLVAAPGRRLEVSPKPGLCPPGAAQGQGAGPAAGLAVVLRQRRTGLMSCGKVGRGRVAGCKHR
jgi:hypothetical protein